MVESRPRAEWVEHLGRAFDAFFSDIKGVLPDESYQHLRASRKELLLAVRAVIDRRIDKLDREQVKARRIEVE
jgi:hypothetical protein